MKPVIGTVVSNKMQKSVVVAVDRLFHNKLYNRYVKRTSKFSFLHLISLPLFEIVFVRSSRPLSKNKHWVVAEIIKKARIYSPQAAAAAIAASASTWMLVLSCLLCLSF
ncbi:hypothetical protein Bca4012_092058 [Brassica carinata]